MKRIDNLKHLEDYGIIPLTGESDAHMYRYLCDVTRRGKAILDRALGVNITFADSWNVGRKADPHIGSFLFPFELLPPVAVFCFLQDTTICEVWLMKDGSVLGFGVEDVEQKEALRTHYEGELRKVFYPMPNDRNVHQMSGRTA
jgi:hypothetical protein